MKERPGQGKRVFSYEEAVALLPEVRRLTAKAYEGVQSDSSNVSPEGHPDAAAQERLSAVVKGWATALMAMGLEVKGLWLVDFDNGSGYYCWRYPESGLHFYHSYEDGFSGRMRIQ
jgi:hypothetical protein